MASAISADDGMSRADRIAWGALLVMVFLVPVAMSNFAFLHDRPPLTYDPFDIVKVFVLRVLAMVALGGVGMAASPARRHVSAGLLSIGSSSRSWSGPRSRPPLRSIQPLPSSDPFAATRASCHSQAMPSSTSSCCSTPTARRGC